MSAKQFDIKGDILMVDCLKDKKEETEQDNKTVVLYAIPDCPKCKNLKGRLAEKKIDFQLCEMNEEEVGKMIEKGFSSAPILDINGQFFNYKDALKWVAGV